MKKIGKLIVIDGTDGSGKATQTTLLVERLKHYGLEVEVADFPQYGKKSASLVEEYLNGKYGTADEVGPYRASIFYAVDRYDASFEINRWLSEGKIVVSNRYVTANMGHQGGKIKNDDVRKEFFSWLNNLEYEIFNIPQPDLNIILHVDAAVAQRLVDNKGVRSYIGGEKRDLHEADIEHLRNAEKVYMEITDNLSNGVLVECSPDNNLLSKEEISGLVWNEVIKMLCADRFYFDKIFGRNNGQAITFGDVSAAPDFINRYEQQSLRVERLSPYAKLPTRAHANDAGLDLYSSDYYSILPGQRATIKTGIRMAIPENHTGLIWDKSGLAKNGIVTTGGVLDAGYRGEVMVNIVNLSQEMFNIIPGQKIAQLLIQKVELPQVVESKIDDETARGTNGFGSTGAF